MGYRFLDLDKLIESREGMAISLIFSSKGEPYFRKLESEILKEIQANRGIILASGGGTPCFFDNMQYINNLGISVFLDIPASDLAKRIENHGKDDRPILSGVSSLELELKQKIEQRMPFYSQAQLTVRGQTEAGELLRLIKPLI